MSRMAGVLLLVALTLSGCASSSASPVPPTPPAATPTAVVARANPRFEGDVGRLLAAAYLISQADSLVESAFAAQSQQFPDSAKGDFADAKRNLDGARRVLDRLRAPSRYRNVASLLSRALSWYAGAVNIGMRYPDRSQVDANRGHTYLTQASLLLDRSPEAGQVATLAAKQAALEFATRTSKSHHRRPRRTRRSSHPPSHGARYVLVPTATPRPTSTPRPTPAPTATPRPNPTPTPSPTATSTATPTPKQVIRKVGRTSRTKKAIRAVTPAQFAHLLTIAVADTTKASTQISRCQGYLRSLGTGDDPLGSIKILACIHHATHRLRRLMEHLAPTVGGAPPTSVAAWVDSATRIAVQAQAELQLAAKDVQSVRLDEAQSKLAAAAGDVRETQRALAQARRSLGAR